MEVIWVITVSIWATNVICCIVLTTKILAVIALCTTTIVYITSTTSTFKGSAWLVCIASSQEVQECIK
ncbi:hypothetical protein BDQ17DRAFT_1441604 [Cyathus striatus]|nr:hypothetical protein BDQ17DRAFT_1441604 [Cyathus striatus]